jgi:DNA-binding SARP family transcriptional activator
VTHLAVHLLGPLRVLDPLGAEIKIASRKSRALLAFLAFRASESHARDRLAALLWEDADEELARTSLRQAIAALRKSLPDDSQSALITATDSVALNAATLDCDVVRFRCSLANPTRASLQEAAQLYRGDLL